MVHRRNNAFGGIVVLVGSLLVVFGAVLPWIELKSAGVAVAAGPVELQAAYKSAMDVGELPTVIMWLGVSTGLIALALIATRVRGLGVMWRIFALMTLAFPAVIAVALWSAVLKGPDTKTLGGMVQSALQNTGLLTTEAGQGLYILTIGAALVLIGCFIPAIRSARVNAFSPAQGRVLQREDYGAPPGWYPVEGGSRYWDGQAWTEHFEPGS